MTAEGEGSWSGASGGGQQVCDYQISVNLAMMWSLDHVQLLLSDAKSERCVCIIESTTRGDCCGTLIEHTPVVCRELKKVTSKLVCEGVLL